MSLFNIDRKGFYEWKTIDVDSASSTLNLEKMKVAYELFTGKKYMKKYRYKDLKEGMKIIFTDDYNSLRSWKKFSPVTIGKIYNVEKKNASIGIINDNNVFWYSGFECADKEKQFCFDIVQEEMKLNPGDSIKITKTGYPYNIKIGKTYLVQKDNYGTLYFIDDQNCCMFLPDKDIHFDIIPAQKQFPIAKKKASIVKVGNYEIVLNHIDNEKLFRKILEL